MSDHLLDNETDEQLKNRLGRTFRHDPRDEKFQIQSILPKQSPGKTYKYWWSNGWWGDQKLSPQCVAYSWVHWLEDGGVTQNHKEPPVLDPTWLYDQCQLNDVWPGEDYDGTSVRAGAKILQREGYISNYFWAWDIDTLVQSLLTTGPVVVGTHWYRDMFFPDNNGLIKVGGVKMGGHAYVLDGINVKTGLIRIKNSWNRSWGRSGFAYISIDDMARLIRENGEICLANEIKKVS